MKVNFDGLRTNATNSMNSLRDTIETIISDDSYQSLDDDLKEEIINKFNEAAMHVDNFNLLESELDGYGSLDDINIERIEDVQ